MLPKIMRVTKIPYQKSFSQEMIQKITNILHQSKKNSLTRNLNNRGIIWELALEEKMISLLNPNLTILHHMANKIT